MRNWINCNDTFKNLALAGIIKPGAQIEVDGSAYLVGDVNNLLGECDHCATIGRNSIVTRYRIVATPQELEST